MPSITPLVAARVNAPVETSNFLETAATIGRTLCREAIWYGIRCNFLTATNDPTLAYPKPYFRAMEADCYGGAAGVGLFLAALYHATGETAFRRTAIGTLHNAAVTAKRLAPPVALGFYSGWTGVAYALLRSSQWLQHEELQAAGLQLLADTLKIDLSTISLDVISGGAGVLPALIQLERDFPTVGLGARIVQLAEHLVRNAAPTARGWSWNTLPGTERPHLTGFAHGAAGIATALLEAYVFTQNATFQEAAWQGFRYENSVFDQHQQNWPDFRVTNAPAPTDPNGAAVVPVCACAWCHGAPGIALSRLRGYELTHVPTLRVEALTGLQTTVKHSTWDQQQNFSLCHGLAGNAEVLLEAAPILEDTSWRQQAELVGHLGQEQYRRTGLWTTGLYNTYQLPDFMLGLAGIGYFYLRLHNSHLYRSMLLLR